MTQRPPTPHPPYDDLRAALGEHPVGHAALDDLQQALGGSHPPSRTAVAEPVARLRAIPVLEARIANWWDSPQVQNWLMILNDAGV